VLFSYSSADYSASCFLGAFARLFLGMKDVPNQLEFFGHFLIGNVLGFV